MKEERSNPHPKKLLISREKLLSLSYVRCHRITHHNIASFSRRKQAPYCDSKLFVGYFGIGAYEALVFFLKSYDRDFEPEGPYRDLRVRPCEAIEPQKVLDIFNGGDYYGIL